MAEGLLAFLRRDLRESLEAGYRRTSAANPGGDDWLIRWMSINILVGLTLFLFCGYHAGFSRFNALAAQAPDWTWQWLTMLGDERVAFALTLFFTRRYPRVFWALIVAALLGTAFTHSIKPLVSAERPPAVLEAGTFNLVGSSYRKESFPSGHTVTASIFFGVWVYYVRARWLRVLLILLAVTAGLSRVALGVHWPVDVAAGMAGGTASAWLGVRLARRGDWLATSPSLHLILVTVAAIMAVSLLFWDRGYEAAAGLQRALGAVALAYGAFGYLVAPVPRFLALKARADQQHRD